MTGQYRMYPPSWPRCDCGRECLDGSLTCGDAACGTQMEAEARRGRQVSGFRFQGPEPEGRNSGPARLLRGDCILCGSSLHRTSACPEIA